MFCLCEEADVRSISKREMHALKRKLKQQEKQSTKYYFYIIVGNARLRLKRRKLKVYFLFIVILESVDKSETAELLSEMPIFWAFETLVNQKLLVDILE